MFAGVVFSSSDSITVDGCSIAEIMHGLPVFSIVLYSQHKHSTLALQTMDAASFIWFRLMVLGFCVCSGFLYVVYGSSFCFMSWSFVFL